MPVGLWRIRTAVSLLFITFDERGHVTGDIRGGLLILVCDMGMIAQVGTVEFVIVL